MSDYIHWLRAQVGPHLLPLVCASALIRNAAGEILLQRRADFGEAWWGLPGGLLEPGETPETALVREVQEETGLNVQPTRLIGVYSSPRYNVIYPNGHQAQQVTACYECAWIAGEVQAASSEITEHRFFALTALPTLPLWYAEMVTHALEAHRRFPYFDAPAFSPTPTPYPNLMAMRAIVGHAPLLWPGANAIVFNDAGELLLHQRADFDVWGLPAGSLDTGETLAETAVRETREETGLEVEPLCLAGIFAGHKVVYPNGDVLYPVGHSFICRLLGGELRGNGEDSLDARFFSMTALPPMPPSMQIRLRAVLANRAALVDQFPALHVLTRLD